MDLQIFVGVIRRHRAVVIVGVALAVLLAVFSYVRVAGFDGWRPTLSYREDQKWQSETRVLVTSPGFSSGSTLLHAGASAEAIQRAEDRLASLALLYADYVTSDDVTAIVRRQGPITGKIVAQAAQATGGTATLPIVDIVSVAPSARTATDLANRYASALSWYVQSQQLRNSLPPDQRVSLETLNRAAQAQLAAPRSRTLPVIVLLAVLSATIGLAFVLENLRNRPPTSGADASSSPGDGPAQRSSLVMAPGVRRGSAEPEPRATRRVGTEPVLPPVIESEPSSEGAEEPTPTASEIRSA